MSPLSCRPTFAVLVALIAALAPTASADAETQCIHLNAPNALEICVQDNGTPGVWVNNSTSGTRAHQYFGQHRGGRPCRWPGLMPPCGSAVPR